MAGTPKADPEGIKAPGIVIDPKAPVGTKMRKEVRLGAIALGALILLAIVVGVLNHSAKKKAAGVQSAASDKPVHSAATDADKMTDLLQAKARKGKPTTEVQGSTAAAGVIAESPNGVPASDVGGELNLPPTKIAQSRNPQAGAVNGGPRQPSPAELRRAEAEAQELAARNSSLSKGGSAGGNRGGVSATPANPLEALGKLASQLGSNPNQAAPGAGVAGTGTTPDPDQNNQADKAAFLDKSRAPNTEPTFAQVSRVAPLTRYEVKAGWDIPATLEQEMNSDLPGDVRGIVRENVYDTATGRYLLIPQGSRVVGSYNSRVAYGQKGLQVVWTRLIYPDGSSINLGGLNGQDVRGQSGFRDRVDNHYGRLIAIAAVTSIFAAGVELSQRQNNAGAGAVYSQPTINQTISASVGQQIGQLGTSLAQKQLNIQPTITIPIGYRFTIRVRKDLIFDAPYAERQAVWR